MAAERVAWWPGGRTAQKAFSSSPAITASVASMAAPADTSAASQVWALILLLCELHLWQVRNLGKPVELAGRYFAEGADEITFLNITGAR